MVVHGFGFLTSYYRGVFDKVAEAGSVQGPVPGQPRAGSRWPSTLVWFVV